MAPQAEGEGAPVIEAVQSYLDQIQAAGASGSVAIAALLLLCAVAMAVKGWRS